MYSYFITFKNGQMLAGSNITIEDETVSLTNYERKITTYNKEDIEIVTERRFIKVGEIKETILFENTKEEEEMINLSELDKKTLEACKKDLAYWENKVFKVEVDKENNRIKVISKRKAKKGKGFSFPLYEELKNIPNNLLEKYVYSKFTTEVYLYL